MNEGAKNKLKGRLVRARRRYDMALGSAGRLLGVLVYGFSLVAVVCRLLDAGFDSSALDRKLLLRLLHIAQGVFIVNILFNYTLRFKASMRSTLFIGKIAAAMMLLTLIPTIWPHTHEATSGFLHFLHSRQFFFTGLAIYSVAELSYGTMQMLGRRTNPSLILSVSFLLFIFAGSLVLMLPNCTTAPIRYIDALFMAASAVSMTGLCTVDFATTFTPTGWLVMAVLMQIGAMGVLTFTSFFAMFFSGRASIYNQLLMRDFIYSKSIGTLMPVILYIFTFTICVEAIGAVGIYMALPDGLYENATDKMLSSAFHSLSAFCNVGFSTLPQGMSDPVLMNGNQAIYLVMSVLILAGGIGFPNLVNLKEAAGEHLRRLRDRLTNRKRQKRIHVYDLNTKLVLIWSAFFFIAGAVVFYILEYNHCFTGLPTWKRIAQAIFCSTTVRTAGFTTYGPGEWLGATLLIAMFMMWVGCASQSMGGGIKINAFAAVMLNLRSIAFGQNGVTAYRRTIAPTSVRRANAVICLSIFAITSSSLIIMVLQPELPMKAVMFEVFSAITTTGMSLGITPQLSDISKIVIASAMFLGRVGIISVLCGTVGNRPDISGMLPSDDIIIN